MPLPRRDDGRHSYADYRSWGGELRHELIDGTAYAMAPAPSRLHQEVLGDLFWQLRGQLGKDRCRVYAAPFDVRLPRGDEADDAVDTVVQPDLCVVCDPAKLDDLGCRGAPDWIIEILSPASASHDQVHKLALYERSGVLEYWLVHPVDRVVTAYLREGDRFGRPDVFELSGSRSSRALPGVRIALDEVGR